MSAAQDLPRGPRDLAGGALPAVGPATRGDGSRRQPGHPHIVTRRPTCCSVEIWVMRDTKPDSKPTQSQPASPESGSLCHVLLVLSFWCRIHGPEQARPPPRQPSPPRAGASAPPMGLWKERKLLPQILGQDRLPPQNCRVAGGTAPGHPGRWGVSGAVPRKPCA